MLRSCASRSSRSRSTTTIVKVHPMGLGAKKKRAPIHRPIPRRMDHQNSYGCRECSHGNNLFPFGWQAHDAPEGRKLLTALGPANRRLQLIMDRAYEGRRNAATGARSGICSGPCLPSPNRLTAWHYSKAIYKRRNENRTAVSPSGQLSSHLLSLREVRRDVHRFYSFRPDR